MAAGAGNGLEIQESVVVERPQKEQQILNGSWSCFVVV